VFALLLTVLELIVHPQPITFDYYVIQEYQRRLKVGRDGKLLVLLS